MARLEIGQIIAVIKEKLPEAVVEEVLDGVDPFVVVKTGQWGEIAQLCRDDSRLGFDLLSCISGVDYPEREEGPEIEVIYHLDSTVNHHGLTIKVKLPRSDPRVASVEEIWRTADWHERETYDLVGVIFEGHHNLVRILCAEDWVGHPLRKDYEPPDSFHGIKNVIY
ncbi:MAG TPA: NADH-quinone oxidoreductase subunit C [Planctomycetes bacterium]|jgi:NADH-quinone oxidoreductase subunit C|nr:NADH-quinone oxidoreductase subunit C [Planctomycetota bacterium]|tara:strand:- start:48 stop:548 length:501 start_codon:yes stop_codon:yes gene_type:complete